MSQTIDGKVDYQLSPDLVAEQLAERAALDITSQLRAGGYVPYECGEVYGFESAPVIFGERGVGFFEILKPVKPIQKKFLWMNWNERRHVRVGELDFYDSAGGLFEEWQLALYGREDAQKITDIVKSVAEKNKRKVLAVLEGFHPLEHHYVL